MLLAFLQNISDFWLKINQTLEKELEQERCRFQKCIFFNPLNKSSSSSEMVNISQFLYSVHSKFQLDWLRYPMSSIAILYWMTTVFKITASTRPKILFSIVNNNKLPVVFVDFIFFAMKLDYVSICVVNPTVYK